jgi:excisionase family DNA binding protein
MAGLNLKRQIELIEDPIRIDPQKLYSRAEAAEITEVSWMTLKRASDAGHLRYRRAGRHYRYLGQDLLDWMAAGGKTGYRNTGGKGAYIKLSAATRRRRELEYARELELKQAA